VATKAKPADEQPEDSGPPPLVSYRFTTPDGVRRESFDLEAILAAYPNAEITHRIETDAGGHSTTGPYDAKAEAKAKAKAVDADAGAEES
jgi:hypothetical protein